jgi:hypothetical protein
MARNFLIELANLQDGNMAAERFERGFAQFERWAGSRIQTFTMDIKRRDEAQAGLVGMGTVDVPPPHHELIATRDQLRFIWKIRDLKTKEWRIYVFRIDPSLDVDPTRLDPFRQAMMHFFKWAAKARVCQNRTCSTPYFFVARKGQKYCCLHCAHLAECASKRRWWRENGTSWRERRKLR